MDAVSLSKLRALITDARSDSAALGSFADRLEQVVAELTPKDAPPVSPADLKRSDGRLTDEAIRMMESQFEAGRRVTDIAADFSITVSATSHRKRIWEGKHKPAK